MGIAGICEPNGLDRKMIEACVRESHKLRSRRGDAVKVFLERTFLSDVRKNMWRVLRRDVGVRTLYSKQSIVGVL